MRRERRKKNEELGRKWKASVLNKDDLRCEKEAKWGTIRRLKDFASFVR